MRVSKDPEVRKKEIIHTAIEVFLEKGYEKTAVSDITNRIQVSQGLFYRYFASKEEIFDIALNEYVKEGIMHYSKLLTNKEKSLKQKLLEFGDVSSIEPEDNEIAKFYNLDDDIQTKVMLKLNLLLIPLVCEALKIANDKQEINITPDEIPYFSSFIIYGQYGVVVGTDSSDEDKKKKTLKLIIKLLDL